MNYHVFSNSNKAIVHFFFRLFLVALLLFFVTIFILEMFSFIRLFEVTIVANPAVNLIK
jgi:hypothetical protein